MSLRSVLGLSKVKKKKTSTSRPRASASGTVNTTASASTSHLAASIWVSNLPRTKPGRRRNGKSAAARDDAEDEDYFQDALDDFGLVNALATDSQLRDVPQAIGYALEHMFEPVPLQSAGSGMNSTKIAALLQYRAALPPVVTIAHLQALLRSPTAVERETAELIRAGTVRRIVVPRRGASDEVLVLGTALADLVRANPALAAPIKEAYLRWLDANPTALFLPPCVPGLGSKQTDALVRAGFLTAQHLAGPPGMHVRPEDSYTMISLERVSQAASGTIAAVGGEAALVSAGGSGAGRGSGSFPSSSSGTSEALRIAVPGYGSFLKLTSTALEHLVGLLEDAPYRQMPESDLRERWNGGLVAGNGSAAIAKRARGELVGVLPGRTKKWRDFHGLAFDFILQEAAGTGRIEVFQTGTVGRAVRLV